MTRIAGAALLACVCVACLAAVGDSTAASDECAAYVRDVPADQVIAQVSVWSNILGLPKSVRSESRRMLTDAASNLDASPAPDDLCPANCTLDEQPTVVFRSVPLKTLDEYDDQAKCTELQTRTSERPMIWEDREFDSIESLGKWLDGFTRGKGADGQDLYRRCVGRCSPRYTCVIDRLADKIVMDTSVICGHARDRKDDRFELSYSLRWSCRAP